MIAVLSAYGLDTEAAFFAALEFWSAMHGFVLLEMTGVMAGIDTDGGVFADMVMRLAAACEADDGSRVASRVAQTVALTCMNATPRRS